MNMQFAAKAASAKPKAKHAIIVVIGKSLKPGSQAKAMDKATSGALTRALAAGAFEGEIGQVESITGVDGLPGDRLVLVGIGEEKDAEAITYQEAGSKVVEHLNQHRVQSAELHLDKPKKRGLDEAEAAAAMAYGARLQSYSFLKYHTTRKEKLTPRLEKFRIVSEEYKAVKTLYDNHEKVAEGVDFARDLVTEPGNIIHPTSYAKECKKLETDGVKVEILTKAQMEKMGMGALLGVAQGSAHEAKMVVMQWMGGKKNDAPVAFVGKGVTFDTGGISLKPSASMEDMKYDMAGSAAVVGVMKALAGRKAKVNAVGVIGLVENMPDAHAQRPGDVVTSMSGQTIEILNTDAEGRLVLADALWYTQDRFKPQLMVDLATLTGAIVVTLGDSRAGLFSNDDVLSERLSEAGNATKEYLWRLPLGDEYNEQINSEIADMKNIGEGRKAGSITAAEFLQRFVNDVPWAHLDIAGVAWSGKGNISGPKGATGFGVRLLNEFVARYYE